MFLEGSQAHCAVSLEVSLALGAAHNRCSGMCVEQVNCWGKSYPVSPNKARGQSKMARINPLWPLNLKGFTGVHIRAHS